MLGDPDEKHPASVVQSWDATKVWIEKAAAMLNGLPLILDDTKLAGTGKNKEFAAAEISQVLYQIAQGRGRGRGSLNGTRSTGSWRTILLSTGEQSAVDFTGDGGSRARVISFWGLPFEKADETTVSIVQEINLAVKENYGHAGPKVIEFILKNQSEWALWKSEYQRMRTKFTLMAGSDSVVIRISDNFAFLATVIPIIHAALPELKQDISPMQIIQPLWDADELLYRLHYLFFSKPAILDIFLPGCSKRIWRPPLPVMVSAVSGSLPLISCSSSSDS
jgi:hypothetical protein